MKHSNFNFFISLKSFIRFLILCISYPKSALSYFGRIVGHIPGFKYEVKRNINAARKFKEAGRVDKYRIGQATHYKNVRLYLFHFLLFQVRVEEGESLTSEHFYLNRSIADLQLLLGLSSDYIKLTKKSLVFDPACGTGRHLHYLVDTFGCNGLGIDVYQPAINVANKANFEKNTSFYCESSLDQQNMDKFITNNLDLVFINSWIGYVKDDKGFNNFISRIIKNSRFIMVVSSINDDLHSIFKCANFVVEYKKGNTQFVLISNENV